MMSDCTLGAFDHIDEQPGEGAAERHPAGADASLLERFQAGDNAAFADLFDRHNNRLFVYCLKMVGSREQARDLTQELWERVIRLRASGQRIINPLGFFLTIARNLSLNHLKARRDHASLASLPESAHPVEALHQRSELEELILAALDLLPFDQREVLVLNIYCGYTMEEIAAMLGKSPDAIWKRASRARQRLRRMVTDDPTQQKEPTTATRTP
jgi:RNA polymerase sigma-70 factor (ECF subfamily)